MVYYLQFDVVPYFDNENETQLESRGNLIFLSEMWPKKNAEFETLNNSLSRSRDDENQTLLVQNDDQDELVDTKVNYHYYDVSYRSEYVEIIFNTTNTNIMNQLCNILRATFIVPFSAGLIKERRNVGFSVHDGSIAGVVLLTTAMIIIFETIVVLPVNQSRLLMIGLAGLALICLVMCSVAARCRSNWVEIKTVKPSDQMKLKFLWLFCIGNIIYQALQLAMHLVCKVYSFQVTLFWAFTWTFQICQTVFIHYFSRFEFANVLCLYYGLLVLFVTNISMWSQQTFYTYRINHDINISNLINSTVSNCLYVDGLSKAVGFLNPYLQPVLLEYSLLSLIFLSEMWPKKKVEFETHNISHSREEDDENQTLLVPNDGLDSEQHPLLPRCSVWHKNSSVDAEDGKKPMFNKEDEGKLVEYAVKRAFLGIGFGKKTYLRYAGQLAQKRGINFKNKIPSDKWWRLHKKRFSDTLTLRKPEATAAIRH
ncbi:unnamed protein product [Mytilus coruscus]|uniref:Uncharacterized protein n=1 Tax=Mytilus coruscus TaxID=42192 RepID=A0A6J8D497_MYTCO|nr:unnamed protein product [Mytilus coruscus]